MEIQLTKGLVAYIDDEDAELVTRYTWHVRESTNGVQYAVTNMRDEDGHWFMRMHRLIMDAPDDMDVDHIDHNGLNNRRNNLRLATRSKNLHHNRRLSGASGYRGVVAKRGGWAARISYNDRMLYLGTYDTPREAALARDAKARELFGEFAYQNIKSGEVT